MPIHQALTRSKQIRTFLPRHEQGGGFAAQGVSRTTEEVGVCMATSGPGATNLVTAIADAKMDSIPLICITGQVPQAMIGKGAFQETDFFGMTLPVVKHSYLITDIKDIPRVVAEAFYIAESGRPGPVLVDLPKDVTASVLRERPELRAFEDWVLAHAAATKTALDAFKNYRKAGMIAINIEEGNDLVDVVLVDEGVPGLVGVDHGHRAAGAAVQAAGLVDPHAAHAGQPGGLDLLLAMVEAGLRGVVGATGLAVAALVEAEEDVSLVVRIRHARAVAAGALATAVGGGPRHRGRAP